MPRRDAVAPYEHESDGDRRAELLDSSRALSTVVGTAAPCLGATQSRPTDTSRPTNTKAMAIAAELLESSRVPYKHDRL